MFTYDEHTIDAAGAFMIGELERLDKTLNMPLFSVSWQRDIDLREDVTMADETASFTLSSFALAGNINPKGKQWIGKNPTDIAGPAVDIAKFPFPLHLWGVEVGWTIPELEAAQQLGRPVDSQKYEAMQTKYQMDVDEQVYIGDADLGAVGLINNPAVSTGNSTLNWSSATPKQILADINDLLDQAWANSGRSIVPDQLRLPPGLFGLLNQPVSDGASISVLKYVADNSLCNNVNGKPLEIQPLKWLTGRGAAGKDRMLAYTRNKRFVRFPLVPMQRTSLQNRGIWQLVVYFCRLGQVEFVYPETVAYMDGGA